jgi:hypothetical protein
MLDRVQAEVDDGGELGAVVARQEAAHRLAKGGEGFIGARGLAGNGPHQDAAAVGGVGFAAGVPGSFEPVDEAVMAPGVRPVRCASAPAVSGPPWR